MKRYGMALLALLLFLAPPTLAAGRPGAGDYTVEVRLTGGTGRASISSPAPLTVTDEGITATLVWSSPSYTQMWLTGSSYSPVQAEGNATFLLPVVLDTPLPVSAETIAMSQPHRIDYVLYLDSSTLKPVGEPSLLPALVAACGGGAVLLLVLVGRRRRVRP